MPDTWVAALVVAVCVLLYGVSKTAMPVAGVLASPILAYVLTPATAAGFILPLLIVGDLIALSYFRQHANFRLIWRLVPGVLIGFALTAVLFFTLTPTGLGRVVGALILTTVVLEGRRFWSARSSRDQAPASGGRLAVVFYGALAGMTSMAANAGGPAMTLYLVRMRVSLLAFMGTATWFFLCLNVIKVGLMAPLGLITATSLRTDLMYVPVIAIGAFVGIRIFRRLDAVRFTTIALILSAVASIWLVVHG